MKLTEQERLALVKRKDEILRLSNEITDNVHSEPNALFIKKNINAILASISTIASFAESKSHKLREFINLTIQLNLLIQESNKDRRWITAKHSLDVWCNMVNSIQFNFTERKALINLPSLDFNLLKQSLSGLKTGIDV